MATITANTGSNNWNTNGAWVGGVQPTAANDVVIPASAVVTIPTAITALGRSLTVQASGAVAFATTTSVLTLGDATAGAGNVALSVSGTATITLTGLGTINFVSTNATQQTITTNGKTMPNLTFNGAGGSWILSDNLTATNSLITVAGGTFNAGAKTHTFGNFATSGATTKVCDFTNTTINGLNIVQPWSIAATGLTLTMTGSTLNCSIGSGTFGGGAFTYGTLNFTAVTTIVAIASSSTFVNLSATGATKNIQLRFNTAGAGAATVTGTLTLGGSTTQGVNRLQVFGITPGNAAQVNCTGAAVVINGDVAFMDVSLTGSPSWANAGSAFVGDCGGNNSLITTNATTPATQTWSGTTSGNWSTNAWTSRVPLPQDNVKIASAFSANQTITADMPLMGADIDFTGTTGTNLSLQRGASISPALFGSLTLVALTLITTTGNWVLSGRSTHTLTSNGATWSFTTGQLVITGGTYTLGDALVTTGALSVTLGTFATNNLAVTAASVLGTGGTMTMGTTVLSLTGLSGTILSISGSVTLSAASCDVTITTASGSARTFTATSKTFKSLTYTVAKSPGVLIIGASASTNTFTTITIASSRTLTIFSGHVVTVTNWVVSGVNNGYFYLPEGAPTGAFASTPDANALDVTGDIDVRVRVALDNWTSLARSTLLEKDDAATNRSYIFSVLTSGKLELIVTTNGSTLIITTSSVSAGLVNGQLTWVRATRVAATGVHTFYTADGTIASPAPSDWVQIGTTVTGTSGNIFSGSGLLYVGAQFSTSTQTPGAAYYRAQVLNGIAGTVVFDADFTAKAFGANTFSESSSNAATVTLNGAIGQVGDGRVSLNSTTPANAATLAFVSRAVSDYLVVQDNTASTTTPAYAGAHGVLVSNTTNWLATAAPSSGTPNLMMMGIS